MVIIKHFAVVVRRTDDVWVGTRMTVGLEALIYWGYLFVLDVCIDMNEALEENLEWLEEMECPCISNLEVNSQYGFDIMPLEKLARELKKMDLVIPFGNRK